MSLSDLRISRKLTLAFGTIVTVFTVVSIIVYTSFSTIRATSDLNDHTFEVINKIGTLEKSFSAKQTGMRGYLVTSNTGSLGSYYDAIKEYDAALPEARSLLSTPEARAKLEEAAAAQQKWQEEIADEELRLMKDGQIEQARKLDNSPAAET